MDADWREVSCGREIVEALEMAGVGVPSLELLLLATQSHRYLQVKQDATSSTPGTFDIKVAGTRFFFNLTACKEFHGDIAVALTTFLVTHSVPVAAIAAALRKLSDNLHLLTGDEVALVRAIIRACPGNPYEQPVAEDAVRTRFRGDPDAVDDLLDSLQRKQVIEGRRRGRVKLVY
jgi:hypothetical protein